MMLFKAYTDKELLTHVQSADPVQQDKALKHIYTTCYPVIKKFIIKEYGDENEARDVFQEAIIIFYQAVRSNQFKEKSSIKTYVTGIGKNIWRTQQRGFIKNNNAIQAISLLPNLNSDAHEQDLVAKEEKQEIVKQCLDKLDSTCQDILIAYYFENLSMRDISNRVGYANEEVAKSKKCKCLKKLIDLVNQYKSSIIEE